MRTIDRTIMNAALEHCFRAAADVERWPVILPHYRWVRFHETDGSGGGVVEMAARRDFGPLPYPVWWMSEMRVDGNAPAVIYRHIRGITSGMDVVWSFSSLAADSTAVEIVHAWEGGPDWPLPGRARSWIADRIIGPIFIHHVATRTLAGVRTAAERTHFEVEGIADHVG